MQLARGIGGKAFFTVTGPLDEVEAAVEAAITVVAPARDPHDGDHPRTTRRSRRVADGAVAVASKEAARYRGQRLRQRKA